jgi:transcriptional antiterminator RfaH
MPILPPEPDLHPPELWESGLLRLPLRDDEGDDAPRWWCLHTKPRQEKATARFLRSRGLAYYLPQRVQEGRTPKGRALRSMVPLFPGYAFLYGDQVARVESLKGNTLASVLPVADQARLDGDLRQIHAMLSSGLPVASEPNYPVGTEVKILDGPLRGLVGVVERRGKGDRFVAVVEFLRQGAVVALHDWQVEPFEAETRNAPSGRPHD